MHNAQQKVIIITAPWDPSHQLGIDEDASVSTSSHPCTAHSQHNRSIAVQDDSPLRKRKLDKAVSDKEQADSAQKKVNSVVASPEAVTGPVVGEEN
jgi:hypothetical protein